MKQILKRLFLSIYYYEKKYEEGRFFDAWWQFTFTLLYGSICFFAIIINLICGLTNITYDPLFYLIAAGILVLFDLAIGKLCRDRYEKFFLDQIESITPFPRWVLYLLATFGILIFIYSFTLIQGSLIIGN